MQQADLAELVAEMFEADTAADRFQAVTKFAEHRQVLERAVFSDLQPEA